MKPVKGFRLVRRKNWFWGPLKILWRLLLPKTVFIHVVSRNGKKSPVQVEVGKLYVCSSHSVTFGNTTDGLFYQLVRFRGSTKGL
jgi:hypothetical protein